MSGTTTTTTTAKTTTTTTEREFREGRVVLISGAAGGIGTELVRRFISDGAHVVATDIDAGRLDALRSTIDTTDRLVTIEGDVSSQDSCRGLASRIGREFGRLDVLVNNAGFFPVCAFEDMSFEAWRQVVTLNLDSVFLMTQALLPLLKKAGKGRIINMGSGSVFKGVPGQTHYVAAKGGVIGLTRSLAWELAEYGINVNIVAPGLTTTDAAVKTLPAAVIEARRNQRPIRRDQVALDVVGAVAFLASEDAAFMTGQIINVDGGSIMH